MNPNYAALAASDGSGEPVRATVQSNRSIGSDSIIVSATTNWPSGTFIATTGTLQSNGTLDPTTAQVFYGTASGTTISITSFAAGYTDKGNSIGDVVVIKPTTEWANLVSEGIVGINTSAGTGWVSANETWTYASSSTINVPSGAKYQTGWLVQFTQSATVKYGVITNITSNVLTLLMLNSATVANSAISANNFSLVLQPYGVSGAWIPYTPTFVNFTLGNGTVVARYSQVGKTVRCRGLVTLGSTSSMGSNPTILLPVTSNSTGYSSPAQHFLGGGIFQHVGVAAYQLICSWASTTTITMWAVLASGTYASIAGISSSAPNSWASTDTFTWDISYEAA